LLTKLQKTPKLQAANPEAQRRSPEYFGNPGFNISENSLAASAWTIKQRALAIGYPARVAPPTDGAEPIADGRGSVLNAQ
jgi:hypothetical protein